MKKVHYLIFAIALSHIVGSPKAIAQAYAITFTVRNLQHNQGPLLPGVKIDIDNGSYMGFTDANGVANIPQIPSGTHNIKISKSGYIKFNQSDYILNSNTSFDACILPKTQIGPWGTNEFDVAKYKATFTMPVLGQGNHDPVQWAQITPIENRITNASSADSALVLQAINQLESMTGYDLITIGNYPEESSYTINMNSNTNFSQIGTDANGIIFVGQSDITSPTQPKLIIHEITRQFDMYPLLAYVYPSVMDPLMSTMTELQPWDANHIAVTFDEHYAKLRGEQDMFLGNIEEYTTPVTPAPTTITSPVNGATNLSTAVNTAWNNIAGSDNYHVDIATDINFTNIVDDLLVYRKDTIVNLEPNSTYYMRVRTENTAGVSSWSATVMFSTINTNVGNTSITLPANGATNVASPVLYNWTTATNATQYNLEVALDNAFTNMVQDVIVPSTNTTLTLDGHRTYFNRVRGENGSTLGQWSGTTTFQTLNHAPSAPTNLTPTPQNPQNSTQPIPFNWTASTDIDNDPLTYKLHIHNAQLDTTFTNIPSNNYTLAANVLQPGTSYTYDVVATDGDLETTSLDQILNTQANPITIGNTSITQPTNGATDVPTNVVYTFSPATNATKYNLEAALDPSFTNLVKDVIVHDLDTMLVMNGNRTYYNRVRGEDDLGNIGQWSSTSTYTTHNTSPQEPTIDSPANGILNPGNYQNGQLIIKYTSTATDIDNDPVTTTVNVTGPGVNETFVTMQNGQVIQGIDSTKFEPDKEYLTTISATDNTATTNGDNVLFRTLLVGLDDLIEAKDLSVYPNPTTGSARIVYHVDSKSHVQLSLRDLSGKTIQKLIDADQNHGEYCIWLQEMHLPNGVYVINLYITQSGVSKAIQAKKLVILK